MQPAALDLAGDERALRPTACVASDAATSGATARVGDAKTRRRSPQAALQPPEGDAGSG
jgi:hypothetical protein